ncbi:NUDIX hydrolase domain-like protein [Aspergillus sergii]|uniref:NUDIX hydrolase domain-like protein n=1 Tax=Aspergillus sergii TaxID=1034303 RepID=A0A5N6WTY0_9EURO|nr:NUDIX hydrolase domain-like protein [Aspergillus sergii]
MPAPIPPQQSIHTYHTSSELEPYKIPINTYISQTASDHLVGVLSASLIIHKDRVLLIQRIADDDWPNVWEVPGGVANDNETIIDCAVRELWEETGLHASAVTTMLGEFEWIDSNSGPSDLPGRGKWKVFIFRVVVDGSDQEQLDVTIDPKEHKAYLWVTEEEVRSDLCGGVRLEWISLNQKKTILEAFEQSWAIHEAALQS